MSEQPSPGDDAGGVLLGLWDRALPQVYGYLLPRCGGQVPIADLPLSADRAQSHQL